MSSRVALAAETTKSASGQVSSTAATNQVTRLPVEIETVVVTGRQDSMIGIAGSASEGMVGTEELQYRTLSRPGEVLETVPGLIITQHSGAGKANQYFLRGFNLDHGTDFATTMDGVPVNLPTHAHGQGYTDLNCMIPELVHRIDYRKGVYYADLGDFSSAGGADIEYFNVLSQTIAQIEGGSFGYVRGLFASSPKLGPGNLLYAVELFHEDGPWTHPDDYQKINGVLRYSQGNDALGFSLTAMGYGGQWNSTDQIARRAVGESFTTPFGTYDNFSPYDSLDPTDGGNSHRYGLSAEWHRQDKNSMTRLSLYGIRYDLDLFSDFTYFLDSPQGGQIEQQDQRWIGGAKGTQTWFGHLGGSDMENTLGLEIRSDSINNGIYQTVGRVRTDKPDYTGGSIPAITRQDKVWEASVSPYLENKVQWVDKFRSGLGLRADYYHFDVNDQLPVNSGTRDAVMVSPKGSLIAGPWNQTEFYLSGGLGFHSNDGRGVTTHIDPSSGTPVQPADPLVRTYGAEIGARTTALPGLQSTLALWWLDIDSELVFDGDAGTTAPSAPSRRYGVEFANYYEPNKWLTFDGDFSFSQARFTQTVYDTDTGKHGIYIPEAVNNVIAAGIAVHQPGEQGWFGELRLRFFGPRPLTEDDSVQSSSTILLSAKGGYNFSRHWTLSVEGFNLLDRKDSEIDYYYPSYIPGVDPVPALGNAPRGVNGDHFKPVEPVSFRVALTMRF